MGLEKNLEVLIEENLKEILSQEGEAGNYCYEYEYDARIDACNTALKLIELQDYRKAQQGIKELFDPKIPLVPLFKKGNIN